eukprot:CAMPEP_0175835684 /NCGR_PEP_ID=MMETSP0107_2-20121207/16725_1 /TAXON_ID=195067 ORGANISM="Goniomonas pacifica, Strain CCMP1869" /NCGR_SAMPLE_ID=MMETSP0107_2 /ASSEMBLY_ACC=CAM_ASM_000203 /LENGTH=91 /DNA_ID=CAMNT_0017148997 /DNA_START=542 /DNA_END=818 /DNA_ORIENTATION=-
MTREMQVVLEGGRFKWFKTPTAAKAQHQSSVLSVRLPQAGEAAGQPVNGFFIKMHDKLAMPGLTVRERYFAAGDVRTRDAWVEAIKAETMS